MLHFFRERIGKPVKIRRGPVAVTGDNDHNKSLLILMGRHDYLNDPEARRPANKAICIYLWQKIGYINIIIEDKNGIPGLK